MTYTIVANESVRIISMILLDCALICGIIGLALLITSQKDDKVKSK